MAETQSYLTATEAADYLRMTVRSLHEHTRTRRVPCRRLAGHRRLLFTRTELDAYLNGAPLESVELPDGGWIVRPVESAAA
jgi:excisionase family DNA binding protein